MKKPKDIGLKVATKREALWLRIKDNQEKDISDLKDVIEAKEEYLKVAERIIQEEQ